MKQPKARILVVEDDPSILNGLLDVLVFNGYAAEGAADGGLGLVAALEKSHDLLLLDVMLPTLDGFSICRQVRKQKPNQAIVMITAKGSEDDVIAGFKAGADDYVSKPFSLRELMVRVEAVLRRSGKQVDGESITLFGILFDGLNLRATCGEAVLEITRREMDIIVYLFRNQQRIVSKKELLTEVWHYADAGIETRTVDIHMQKLRKKLLSLNPESTLIQTIRGEGYRLEPGP
ncbi:MAG: response regulator transcription factor [Deltaproteobacteria bacterium]|nr:response regulator transcription factor [Deltaproteobacteria bacterium]